MFYRILSPLLACVCLWQSTAPVVFPTAENDVPLLSVSTSAALGNCEDNGVLSDAGNAAVPLTADSLLTDAVPAPSVSAEAAVLLCADNGAVLYEKNADVPLPIASITKTMTAIIALEYAQTNDKAVVFTPDMQAEGSSLYLQAGDTLRLSELVKGLMMVSGNDAANAIAVGIAGSTEAFADLMNRKAQQLGMKHSHFVTPSGLDDAQHYASAYDMALLCCYAMQNEQFAAIVSQKKQTVRYLSPEHKTQVCVNHNRLLSLYDGCIGIKTGFTKKAGRTLTSCAERNGVRLIAVTLHDPDDWRDHQALFDYGFSLTERNTVLTTGDTFYLPVVGGQADSVAVHPADEVSLTQLKNTPGTIRLSLMMPHFVYAPVTRDQAVGEVVVYHNEQPIAAVKLLTDTSVELQKEEELWNTQKK